MKLTPRRYRFGIIDDVYQWNRIDRSALYTLAHNIQVGAALEYVRREGFKAGAIVAEYWSVR